MIILIIELFGYFFLSVLAFMILLWILTTILEIFLESVKKSSSKKLHSLFKKKNSTEIFSLLLEIRKKPFLLRTQLDNEIESVLSTRINEYISIARFKYSNKK